jgi:hypothetical protein
MSGRIADVASLATLHVVVDRDGTHILIAITMHEGSHVNDHLTIRLVSDHLSKDCRAYGTSDPVFVSFEVIEATFVKQMTT